MLALAFLVAVVVSWRYIRTSYRIYTATILLLSFSYYTGPVHPYMGLPRHLLLAFPVFIGLAPWIREQRMQTPVMVLGGLGWFFMLMLYVLETWVP